MTRTDLDAHLTRLGPIPQEGRRRTRTRWYEDLCDVLVPALMADPAAEDRLLRATFATRRDPDPRRRGNKRRRARVLPR